MRKRESIVIIVVLIVMVIAIVGVSYAAFNYSRIGSINSITTGAITMTYEETSNTISLNGALPTTDKTGMVRLNPGEYFDFSISSKITGNVNINYEISAKDITTSDRKIDGSNIKLYLTKLNGDNEEALMVPETYNEEESENTYTGRPSGEMSLYTSSMNSSESNNYRLRMYVDEGYNPQGDGGNLQFTIQINVYGKAGDKYVSVGETILTSNELQEEKTQMFNYASNGNYTNSSYDELNDPEYVTNGLYSMEDEDGTSYYYRGNVDNNNVQFGTYDSDYYVYHSKGEYNSDLYFQSLESCQEYNSSCSESDRIKLASRGDKMYWKIVRVNGDGSLRLIYNGTSVNPDNSDLAHSYTVGSSPYNLNADNPKYTGYTYDRDTNETDSFIKREVDTWYKNTIGSNSSYDSKVVGGRFCSDSSGYKKGTDYDFPSKDYNVFASVDRLGQSDNNFAKPNNPSLKCPSTSESYGGSYRLKAGLITADELVLAGVSMGVTGNSYLTSGDGLSYWGMTPFAFAYNRADVSTLISYLGLVFNAVDSTDGSYGVRPVININANSKFASGDGTAENPYVITAE